MFKSAIARCNCAYRLVGISAVLSFFYITPAQAGQLTLAWNASTSSGVAGYQISYGQASGSYTTHVDAGNKTSYTITGLQDGKKYYFAAKAYNSGKTAWSGFSNEVSATPTASLPDVVVTTLSYANGIFTSTVKNQGTAATPSGVPVGVGYFVDGVKRTWGSVSGPLAAGASVTIGTNGGAYTIPTGTHTYKAYVDDVNRFIESDETNNQLATNTSPPPPPPPSTSLPDVIVTSLSYASGVFTSTVKNQGTAATPAGIAIGVGYFVDGVSRTWGAVANPPLAAGQSATVGTNAAPYTIPNGTHTITAHADGANRFAESNETNNKLSQPITVP